MRREVSPTNESQKQQRRLKVDKRYLCGLYGRVSTQRQALIEDGGLDTQFSQMEKRVQFENDMGSDGSWEIVDRYREEGRSGKDLERPEFKRMMNDIREGKVNTVIVYKIDRITRSLRDFYDLWETFEEYGVQFVSLHEKFDTTTAVGRAMLKLILVFAELEREQTAERTSATMRHRAEQGLWNGGHRLGYDLDRDNKGYLNVNPDEKRIVREHFFAKCVELGSASKVVQHLKEQGIRRPKRTSRSGKVSGGGPYYKQPVVNVLTDKVYIGKIEFKGEVFEGQHEAIIDEDLFDQVQEIIAANRETCSNGKAQGEHVFLLQGLIRCGKCGSMMTPKWCSGRGGTRNFYYACTRNNHSVGAECNARYLPAPAVETFVTEQVERWTDDEKALEKAVEKASNHQDGELERLADELRDVNRRVRETQASLSRLVAAVADGADFRTFEERIQALELDRATLEGRAAELELEIESARDETPSLDAVTETFCDFPLVVGKLRKSGKLHELKELIACYIAAINVYQEEDDPSSGRMDIMVFEKEVPSQKGVRAHKKTLTAASVNDGNCERLEKLPRQDSNLRQGG